MKSHSHIVLCDEKWFFYYDHIDFNIKDSIVSYLDIMFNNFISDGIPREEIEEEMYFRVDEDIKNPIYFKVGEYFYLWIYCTGCRLVGLN
jgi:hypothetical protein